MALLSGSVACSIPVSCALNCTLIASSPPPKLSNQKDSGASDPSPSAARARGSQSPKTQRQTFANFLAGAEAGPEKDSTSSARVLAPRTFQKIDSYGFVIGLSYCNFTYQKLGTYLPGIPCRRLVSKRPAEETIIAFCASIRSNQYERQERFNISSPS